ncbi:chemotaxis protein CheW [Komagataeibacter sp. FXV3]|uniref:chemotaxis protein CheW n=1 Tax=Komagataeibacter sp. FXV3 TaxID=2608998 RepID=UPI00187BB463|nr:chemotaxis protein CheW [Komagataeibacter sp. FXV3]MBE7729555.1 chemotaxis protein CheW [Komagataeibacter sp. FXV3]
MDNATPQQGKGYGSGRPPLPPVMIFRVGSRQYGLPAGLVVRECMPVPELMPVAVALPHVSGWFRLGAAMVVVIDLGVLLGERTQAVRQPVDLLYCPLLLCNLPGGGSVALLVDAVCAVTRQPAPVAPATVDGDMAGGTDAGRELELADGGIAFMLRMTDIINDDERMRLDTLMERTRARATLWAAIDTPQPDMPGDGHGEGRS